MMQTSISYLRRLPIYFSQCQDLVVNSRRSQLVQKFVLALTQGGPSGQVFRAMDLHVNDSIRYVGDMLAWMHQAIASEEEFLEAVFGEPSSKNVRRNSSTMNDDAINSSMIAVSVNGTGSNSSSGKDKGINSGRESFSSSANNTADTPTATSSSSKSTQELVGLSVHELLARCLQGLGRPLRVRIQQVTYSL